MQIGHSIVQFSVDRSKLVTAIMVGVTIFLQLMAEGSRTCDQSRSPIKAGKRKNPPPLRGKLYRGAFKKGFR
jgi:hypothetical protein